MTLNEDGNITSNNIYEPFGKQIPLLQGESTRLSFISKEKDIESSLGDFGVRKYDEETGRFTSIDPLWEKYLRYSPYHYCGNNPVMGKDPSGMVVHKLDFTENQEKIYDDSINKLRSINSPTINYILDAADGKDSEIYFRFMTGDRPLSTKTKSCLGYSGFLEDVWNQSDGIGGTITTKEGNDMIGEIMIDENKSLGWYDDNKMLDDSVIPFAILDELNHAVSLLPVSNEKEKIDYQNLFNNIMKEIQNGTIQVPWTWERRINDEVK